MTNGGRKQTKKHSRAAHSANVGADDWGALLHQLSEVLDWGLDLAAKLSRHDADDLDAIDRVRAFVRGWLGGHRAEIPLTDLLRAIAILFAAIEIDLGIDSVELLSPLRAMRDEPSVLPPVLRCPGAYRDGAATVRIRRFPARRNASPTSIHLAA